MLRRLVIFFLTISLGAWSTGEPAETQADQTTEQQLNNDLTTTEQTTELSNQSNMPSAEDIAESDYYDNLSLLAELVQAEAGNQDEKGKRLVADVVLNRVESDRFPDSIPEVIYQDKQFSTVLDGALMDAGWHMDQSDYDAVWAEATAEHRLDENILFFTAGKYNAYCTPMYKYGDHYFGK
ncbi:MAG: cell wall hydrolase [Lachnospiraceae bacterium]|nr:cell wall hydrolase [Lachnospiraceae bacterium]